jgi:hypothetical protein
MQKQRESQSQVHGDWDLRNPAVKKLFDTKANHFAVALVPFRASSNHVVADCSSSKPPGSGWFAPPPATGLL